MENLFIGNSNAPRGYKSPYKFHVVDGKVAVGAAVSTIAIGKEVLFSNV
jgi:hypothetical protein